MTVPDDGVAAGLILPARSIPVPNTISAEAQAFLASGGMPQGKTPAPSDKEGWRQQIAAVNANLTQMTQMASARFKASTSSRELSACTLYEITPEERDAERTDAAIYFVHGGGFTVGGGIAAAYSAIPIAAASGLRTFSVDYRMPPDHPFPHGLNDALEGYQELLKSYPPERIMVVGVSAGGGLAASLLLKARDKGLPLPAGCVLHTPEVDLTESGDTFETNDTLDIVLHHRLSDSIALYADGHDLKDPYLSPVEGDYEPGFAPTLLFSGTRDLFLSNTVRMHRTLRRAGIRADLHVFEAMPHGGFFGAPEDQEIVGEELLFFREHLPAM